MVVAKKQYCGCEVVSVYFASQPHLPSQSCGWLEGMLWDGLGWYEVYVMYGLPGTCKGCAECPGRLGSFHKLGSWPSWVDMWLGDVLRRSRSRGSVYLVRNLSSLAKE